MGVGGVGGVNKLLDVWHFWGSTNFSTLHFSKWQKSAKLGVPFTNFLQFNMKTYRRSEQIIETIMLLHPNYY